MTTKTVYQCDENGVFLAPAVAYESPREPGVFHIPAGCVELAPPEIIEAHAAVWSGNAWAVLPDHRGETWYLDGVATVIAVVGDPVDEGYVATPPAPTIEDLRAAKITAIVAAADALLSAGAPVADGLHVALDNGSRADLTAMAQVASSAISGALSWPESYARGWITIENTRVPLATPTEGLTFAATVGNYYAALVQNRRDLKDAALAAESAAALDAIDIAASWPIAT